MKEYAKSSDEPIVLVYFGDHLPGFSNGMQFFDLLDYPIDANGSPEEQLAVYETPYLIWQNESAKALKNTKTAAEIGLPENGLISSQFLGSAVNELFLSTESFCSMKIISCAENCLFVQKISMLMQTEPTKQKFRRTAENAAAPDKLAILQAFDRKEPLTAYRNLFHTRISLGVFLLRGVFALALWTRM